ncbi:MAG: tetratricopeptide repeat protein [Algibacter sp.]|uniref:tetratricopeptide repeat protein n=1 Tax=Algibacter sp. TaxID=1872428 RepID=UPI002611DC91|nr:tetratricopeptide repeat protein [Algibacter sp.]MDG1927532.1 tetratricopeptide repeat protein [Flavobacteriaceae bacterium]MDG2177536.1 tetratricopeptide repeat protein [Algibacter sp.]
MKKLFIIILPILISCNSLSDEDESALVYSYLFVDKIVKNNECFSIEFFNERQKQWDYKTKTAYSSADKKSYQIKNAKNIRKLNEFMFYSYYKQSICHFEKWKDEFVNQNNTEKAYHLSLAKEFLNNASEIYNNDRKFLECENCELLLFWISQIKNFQNDLKDFKGDISDYSKAIDLNPDFSKARLIADFLELGELFANDADAYYSRGNSRDDLKDFNGAISDYNKAIELNPNSAKAYYSRGNSKYDLKDYNGAISDYTKVIELNPNSANAYYNRGVSKSDLKDFNGAISDYTKVIELIPNDALAYYNRSVCKELLEDLNGACEDAKKAISLGSKNSLKWVSENCN